MLIGATYSHKRILQFFPDQIAPLRELLQLKLDIIRLCCYWSRIEKRPGEYDFSEIKKLLELCEAYNQTVVLTVGMKAPDAPEYYIPSWIKEYKPIHLFPKVSQFIKKTIVELKNYNCISLWQVENEPLDPTGHDKLSIPIELLRKEVLLVRSIDPKREIIITKWANSNTIYKHLPQISDIADIIGLDIYYKHFLKRVFSLSFYSGPRNSGEAISKYMKKLNKPFWITELQADPWEANVKDYRSENPRSMNQKLLIQNFSRALKMNPYAILLWGSEYWLWKKSIGDTSMLNTVREIITRKNS